MKNNKQTKKHQSFPLARLITSLLLTFTLLFSLSAFTSTHQAFAQTTTQTPAISVTVNGHPVAFTTSTGYPFVDENHRTLVPFRVALEAMGINVFWNNGTRTAMGHKDDTLVEVPIGQNHIYINGALTPNDTAAIITPEGRTYLPIARVARAFGAETLWDSVTRTVAITLSQPDHQEIQLPLDASQETDEMDQSNLALLAQALEDQITFTNEEKLFALYAFINHTGYDEENHPKGMSDTRLAVRETLNTQNLNLRDSGYFQRKNLDFSQYLRALSVMDDQYYYRNAALIQRELPALQDLDLHLREFAQKANIKRLYRTHGPAYQEAADIYHDDIFQLLAGINHYFHRTHKDVTPLRFQVNLLESHLRGYWLSGGFGTDGKNALMVVGPSKDPDMRVVAHEYLHTILSPVNDQLEKEIDSLSHLMDLVPPNTQATRATYNTWHHVFDESMVRALELRLLNEASREIQWQMDQGFILTAYFHQRFAQWEDHTGSLETFIRSTIKDLQQQDPVDLLGPLN